MKSLLVIISVSLFASQVFACKTPSKSQLKKIFGGQSSWTEIDPDTKKKEPNKTIKIVINFDNPNKSKVFKSGKPVKGEATICSTPKGVLVKTNLGKVNLYRASGGIVVDHGIPLKAPWILWPSNKVVASAQSNVTLASYSDPAYEIRKAKIKRINEQTNAIRRERASYQGSSVQRSIASSIDI